jgi:hypothetical protein
MAVAWTKPWDASVAKHVRAFSHPLSATDRWRFAAGPARQGGSGSVRHRAEVVGGARRTRARGLVAREAWPHAPAAGPGRHPGAGRPQTSSPMRPLHSPCSRCWRHGRQAIPTLGPSCGPRGRRPGGRPPCPTGARPCVPRGGGPGGRRRPSGDARGPKTSPVVTPRPARRHAHGAPVGARRTPPLALPLVRSTPKRQRRWASSCGPVEGAARKRCTPALMLCPAGPTAGAGHTVLTRGGATVGLAPSAYRTPQVRGPVRAVAGRGTAWAHGVIPRPPHACGGATVAAAMLPTRLSAHTMGRG